MSTKTIRDSIIGLMFASLLVPFVVFDNSYFPYIFGKGVVFRIIILAALILWAMLIYRDSKFFPSKNCVTFSFLSLVCIYLVSAIFGVDVVESIFSGYERMDGWVTTAFIFVFFLIISSVIKEKKMWNNLFFAQIVLSLPLFFIGIIELLKGGINFRIDATLGNPIYLAVVFLFSIFFAAYLLFEDYSKSTKIFLASTILINMLGVFFTGTRGSMVAIFVAGLFLTVFFAVKFWKTKKVRTLSLAILSVAILAPILLLTFKESNFVKNNGTLTRLTQINITEGTGYARFINWGIAVDGIKAKPILGWGQGNFSYVFDKYYDARMYAQEPFFDRSHNIVLDTLVQGGILALLAYLSIFGFVIYFIFKKVDIRLEQKFILSALLLAYFIQNIFVFDNLTSYMLFAIVMAFSIYDKQSKTENKNIAMVILAISIIVSLIAFVYTIYQPWRANSNLIKGMQLTTRDANGNVKLLYPDGLADNRRFFEKALQNNFAGRDEIKFASLGVVDNMIRIQTNDKKIQSDINDFVGFAYQQFLDGTKEKPQNPRILYYTGIFSTVVGDLQSAEKFLERAVDISNDRQLYLERLASVKKELKKEDEYFQIVERIYFLETTNDKAWLDYSNLLSIKDKQAYLNFLLESKSEERILKSIDIFDNAISRASTSPQVYVNKGVFLSKVGKTEDAIKVFEEMKIKFPELKTQIDPWISDLKVGKLPE